MSDPASNRRHLPRFSLRSLILFLLLVTSGTGLWYRWEPWAAIKLTGHESTVWAADFDSTSSRVITASSDGTARIWDAVTGECLITLKGHAGEVRATQFISDGDYAVTASFDGSVKIWDARTGTLTKEMVGHTAPVYGLAVSDNEKLLATTDKTGITIVWDIAKGALGKILPKSPEWIAHLSFAQGDNLLLTSTRLNTSTEVWDVRTGRRSSSLAGALLRCYPDHGVIITRVFSVPKQSSELRVWDESTLALKYVLKEADIPVSLAPGNQILLSGGPKGVLKAYDVESGTLRTSTLLGRSLEEIIADRTSASIPIASVPLLLANYIPAHVPGLNRIAVISPESLLIVMDSKDYSDVWQTDIPEAISLSVAPDGETLAISTWGEEARIFRRRRPEYWWGVAWLPEFWLTVVLGVGLVFSLWRDSRIMRA